MDVVTSGKNFLLLLFIFLRKLFSSDRHLILVAISSPNKSLGLAPESNSLIKGVNSGARPPLSQCLQKLDKLLNAKLKRIMDCRKECKRSPMVNCSLSSLILCQMIEFWTEICLHLEVILLDDFKLFVWSPC